MRLLWATPADARSAIGRSGIGVAEILSRRGHEVELLDLQQDRGPPGALHATALPLTHWRDMPASEIRTRFDLVVAEIGDYFTFHAGLFPLLDAQDCVGIFHDFYLYDLFAGWLFDRGLGADVHDGEVVLTYGLGSEAHARQVRSGALNQAEIARHLPMTEWIARRCRAAVAHSSFYAARLEAACPGPVATLPLSWTARAVPPLPPRSGGPLVVLTVGVMNPNKCMDRVIAAIAGSPHLRETVEYRLAGPVEDVQRARLERLADELGYRGLRILGPVSDADLEAQLAAADVISCLRDPVLEGGSASAIEGLLSGRPVLVADAGFYADLPEHLVFKVPPEVPPAAVAAQLERLASEEPLRRRIGADASAWASDTFAPERYAARLEALLVETEARLPLLRLGAALADEMVRLGLTRGDPVIDRLVHSLGGVLAD
ncbi:glycosyltransferase family 4 protein [Phenylobacterium sp.]|jgi:glycosyltransferase involved in cell wall biosynthesis|uniref:glycosyltransferase family 4 protein n=1 Tax=Phenylobacterium sp. TaxID=1871053 RepID=UPI002F95930B